MKRLRLFVLVILSIICTSINAFAAQMKYSIKFNVGSAQFDGNALMPSKIATLDFYGDTDNIIYDIDKQKLLDLKGDLTIDGIGTYAILNPWSVLCEVKPGGIIIWGDAIPLIAIDPDIEGNSSLLGEMIILEPGGATLAGGSELSTTGGTYSQLIGDGSFLSYSNTVVPIPNALLLLSSGLTLLIGFRRKFSQV